MYGPEYLDWRAEEKAGCWVDAFLAEMEPEDRKWVLAVLRKRFEVRVEYRDSPLAQLGRLANQGLQNTLARQGEHRQYAPPFGGAFGGLLGG